MAKSGIKKKTRNCLINILNKWILSILIWRITAKIKQSIKDFVKDKKQRCCVKKRKWSSKIGINLFKSVLLNILDIIFTSFFIIHYP